MPPSSDSTARAGIRLDSLTSLRWFAAFGVFLFHLRNIVTFPGWFEWLAVDGYLGVTFFFVLSGFVLTWSWRRTTPVKAFYWRRFARIYPLHLLTLLIAIPVFYRLVVPEGQWWIKPLDAGVLFLSVLVIQGWWLAPSILFSGNPAAWTLTVEAFFYALHPAIVRSMLRLRARGALIGCVLVVVVAFILRVTILVWPDSGFARIPEPVMHLPSFVLGMLLAWAYRQGWRLQLPIVVPTAALIGWLLFVALAARAQIGLPGFFTAEVVALLCALMIAAAATKDTEGKRGILTWRPLVALGEWSFAFYLIHATLMYALMEFIGPRHGSYWQTMLWGVILLALAIFAAWALHHFVERPMEKRMRAWQDRRLARRSADQPAVSR